MDRLNSMFYGKFPFPWPADLFVSYDDSDLWRTLTNQELGDFSGSGPIPRGARIWVAGCGVNQGVQTALRFPGCTVYATDVSGQSLRIAESAARSIGVTNVSFEQRSINEGVDEKFDYVLCTGVIHHNADPGVTLKALMSGLADNGVLELMVYNRYHRQETTALQKAIRLLASDGQGRDDHMQLSIAERLMDGLAGESSVLEFLRGQKGGHTSALADSVIQPVEWSYTVSSLAELADSAGALLWLPTRNVFDTVAGRSWTLDFTDSSLRDRYRSLGDVDRWQLANLLLAERSPWLWFYLRHSSVLRPPHLCDEVSRAFLDVSFTPIDTQATAYRRQHESGSYVPLARRGRHPAAPPPQHTRAAFEALRTGATAGEALRRGEDFPETEKLTEIRETLTTPMFPYLRVVGDN
ncbi:class I SAM-dependent methyltransferase [Streptomyces pseudogriseolus]|uniref:class I SAM-dependent methyltransferase n=1 Tax=Streptomyces pseudogriseolus TaxID=36817 RepID=UPI003FA22265